MFNIFIRSEIILTHGNCDSVLAFLRGAATADEDASQLSGDAQHSREAHEARVFEVFVCEGAPSCSGHAAAAALAQSCDSITATVVKDEDLFALMARVNKVV